jgi:hypothetical protein
MSNSDASDYPQMDSDTSGESSRVWIAFLILTILAMTVCGCCYWSFSPRRLYAAWNAGTNKGMDLPQSCRQPGKTVAPLDKTLDGREDCAV